MRKTIKILTLLFVFISVDVKSQQNELQNFSIKDGLPSLIINDITQDNIGYLWLATNKGLVNFDGNKFSHYKNHSQSKANTVFVKNDLFLIAHTNGLFKKESDKFIFLGKEKILKIVEINSKIILATTEGIYQLKEDYLQPLQINTKIDFAIINDIIVFKNEIYIATNKGLWNIDKISNPKKVSKLSEDIIHFFLLNNDKLIATTSNNELKVIKQSKTTKSINVDGEITSIKKINNELWVTTSNNGIAIFNSDDLSFKQRINKYNSDISNLLNTVFKDNQNTIWIASKNKGLYKYRNTETSNSQRFKPEIYIENITVNYLNVDSLNTKKLNLKSTENNISFTYKTVDLQQPKLIKYRYKLVGNFSPWSTKNSIEFANLNAGNYTFILQSKKGKKISDPKKISFLIDAPFYKKIWFIILCFAILFFVLALLIDLNINKLKKKNQQKVNNLKLENHLLNLKQRALQLQMNPHFIFNVLNGIKALGNTGNTKELNKTISQFSILLRSVLNNSRLEEISLKDEIETLKNYLDLEKKMSSKIFEYTIETNLNNIDSEEILIPPMLLQPFIENSIKHGFTPTLKKGKIEINFEVKHQFLQCSIIDNGIGLHQSKKQKINTKHKSVALKVTKERIQNLSKNNSFSIIEIKEDNNILGTKVEFKIPLKTDY